MMTTKNILLLLLLAAAVFLLGPYFGFLNNSENLNNPPAKEFEPQQQRVIEDKSKPSEQNSEYPSKNDSLSDIENMLK